MYRKKLLIIISIFAVLLSTLAGVIWYKRDTVHHYTTVMVKRGTIIEESTATGKVEAPTKIDLHFKNSGRLSVMKAAVGKNIEVGDILAQQESTQLDTLVAEMQADINLQRARLNQLLAGSSNQDIAVAETSVNSATVVINNSKKSLENAKQSAVDILKDSYTRSDDAVRNNIDQIFTNAQTSNPQLIFSSVTDANLEIEVETMRLKLETVLKNWSVSVASVSTDTDLTEEFASTKNNLETVRIFLDKVALLINNPNNKPSNIPQVVWDGWRGNIASSRANINSALSGLSFAEESITAKESAIQSAEANLKTAKEQLALKKAPTRSTDIAVYQAQIEQAVAGMKKVQTQKQDLILTSPTKGVVTETNGEIGEIISPATPVVSILAGGTLQIKLNVVEDNIVRIKVGQQAKITLDAVPDRELMGTVIAIDPAETKISGAVYYQTTIVFNQAEDFVRSGMTANVWIQTDISTSTLFIPVSAIIKKDQLRFVRILSGQNVTEREIITGLKNRVGMIEVLSGLNEGDNIVLDQIK